MEALARAAPHGRAVRDHLRRRRQPRRHGADRRPPGGRAPRRRARRPPRRQPRLRRRGPLGAGLGALPAGVLHRRRPTVPRRGPGLPAGPAGGGSALRRAADVVVGYRIRRADPPIRLAYARVYRACLRLFFGLRRARPRLRLQALPAQRAGGRARRVGWGLPVRGAAHQDQPTGRPHRRAGRAALPADGRAGLRGGPARGRSCRARLLGAAPAALGRRAGAPCGAEQPSCPTRATPPADRAPEPRPGLPPATQGTCASTGRRATPALRQPGSPPPGPRPPGGRSSRGRSSSGTSKPPPAEPPSPRRRVKVRRQRVDEVTEDAEPLLLVGLGDDGRPVEHGVRGEDGG